MVARHHRVLRQDEGGDADMEAQVRMDLVFPLSGQEVVVCVPRDVADTAKARAPSVTAVCWERPSTRLECRPDDVGRDRH